MMDREVANPLARASRLRRSSFQIDSSLVVDHSSFRAAAAFTIIELIAVIGIILVLAGLVLATSNYLHNKGARVRAEAEIAAISAALENYKADNGLYPTSTETNALNAQSDLDPSQPMYHSASLYLYQQLSGDLDGDRSAEAKSYITFKDNQLSPANGSVAYVKDPFGNSYGYSTVNSTDPTKGYNPTFDLWATGNSTSQTQWIKNW